MERPECCPQRSAMQLHNISLLRSQRPKKILVRQGWTAAVQLACGFHAKEFADWKQWKNGAPLTSPQEGDLKQPAYPQVFKCGIPSWTGHKLMCRVWGPWEQSPLPFPGLMARKVCLLKRCLPGADSGRRGNMLRNF